MYHLLSILHLTNYKEWIKMRKTLQIRNHHDWTVEHLQAFERTVKNANMAKRDAEIRFVMQGYMGLEVADLFNLHRQSGFYLCPKFQ